MHPSLDLSSLSRPDQFRNGGVPGKQPGSSAWRDDFTGTSLDPSRWTIAKEEAPGYIPENHRGVYDPSNVFVQNGNLVIRLVQRNGLVDGVSGVESLGGLVFTPDTFAYGNYQWRARMSSTAATPGGAGSPVSGSVSAGFNYINNSETEINFEFSSHLPGWLWLANWRNLNPSNGPFDSWRQHCATPVSDLTSAFHTYQFVWDSSKVAFYLDDVFLASHVKYVPNVPAHFMINHWGTNNLGWGGQATVGVPRYFYIDWVSYSPPQE